ncbi:type II toxin-antitoxin system PemK/MazF family toxin [Microbacterium ulmi]
MTDVTQRQGILGAIAGLFGGSSRSHAAARARVAQEQDAEPGRSGPTATLEIEPPARDGLRITYTPDKDGDPDAGEVVWTWVPYDERDGRGKDRPVLVIGRQSVERVYAVRLTSKSHEGSRDFLSIGPGSWDSQGRPSWIDIEQIYSVHADGMRREASVLDLDRFVVVANALHRRYGWDAGR